MIYVVKDFHFLTKVSIVSFVAEKATLRYSLTSRNMKSLFFPLTISSYILFTAISVKIMAFLTLSLKCDLCKLAATQS